MNDYGLEIFGTLRNHLSKKRIIETNLRKDKIDAIV